MNAACRSDSEENDLKRDALRMCTWPEIANTEPYAYFGMISYDIKL